MITFLSPAQAGVPTFALDSNGDASLKRPVTQRRHLGNVIWPATFRLLREVRGRDLTTTRQENGQRPRQPTFHRDKRLITSNRFWSPGVVFSALSQTVRAPSLSPIIQSTSDRWA